MEVWNIVIEIVVEMNSTIIQRTNGDKIVSAMFSIGGNYICLTVDGDIVDFFFQCRRYVFLINRRRENMEISFKSAWSNNSVNALPNSETELVHIVHHVPGWGVPYTPKSMECEYTIPNDV